MEAFSAWLSTTSLAPVAGILFVTVGGALLLGWLVRHKVPRAPQEGDTLLTSSVLGLLALLLSFTFALATDRYETRRILVQTEANAIGTMYLRSQLLEEPHRAELSRILIAYTDNRIALAKAKPNENADLLATNDRLLRDFWTAAAATFPSIRDLDFSSTFYDSVNQMIDLDATRKSARMARVPPLVFILLFIYVAASAAMLGFFAVGRRGFAQSALFLFLLVLVLLVVVDIDQPSLGGIRESQAPMERLRATLP
jgi:hypothetical protein